jgi:hypothetical protein
MSAMGWRARTTRTVPLALVALLLVALSACEGMGSAQGGASDHGRHGRIKMGVPF